MLGFERENDIFVSVILVTRGRPEHLKKAIASLYDKSYNKHAIEYLLKVDSDDTLTIEAVKELAKIYPVKAIVSERSSGYRMMHIWTSQLSSLAKGDWLFVFNDDALMTTDGWDHILLFTGVSECWHDVSDMIMLSPVTIGRPECHEFPMIRRRAFEYLGHWALNPHLDNWIFTVFEMNKSVFRIGLFIEHISGSIGDKTREESEKTYEVSSKVLYNRNNVKQKIIDAQRVFDYIDQRNTVPQKEL